MNLAEPVENFVERARTVLISFKGLLFLASIGRYIHGITAAIFMSALVLIAPRLAVAIAHLRGSSFVAMRAVSQPVVLACAKAGHQRGKGCHGS